MIGLKTTIVVEELLAASFLLKLHIIVIVLVGVEREYYPGAEWDGIKPHFDGYQLQDLPVYNVSVDGDNKYGSSSGLPRRPFVGGYWTSGQVWGSRCMVSYDFSASVNGTFSTRGCNYNLIILGLQYIPILHTQCVWITIKEAWHQYIIHL